MSETVYLTAVGFVQKFGDKPAVATREVSGQTVRDVTIKAAGSQKLVKVTLWPEHAGVSVDENTVLFVDGKYTRSQGQDGREYHNLSASKVAVLAVAQKAEREVVNQTPAANQSEGTSSGGDSSPF